MNRPHITSGGRYPVLRALAIIELVLAALWPVSGLIGAIYTANWAGTTASFGDKVVMGLGIFAGSCFMMILTLAFAELIKLLIDIEHNTRMASTLAAANGQTPSLGATGQVNRIKMLEEESAEVALLRGH